MGGSAPNCPAPHNTCSEGTETNYMHQLRAPQTPLCRIAGMGLHVELDMTNYPKVSICEIQKTQDREPQTVMGKLLCCGSFVFARLAVGLLLIDVVLALL